MGGDQQLLHMLRANDNPWTCTCKILPLQRLEDRLDDQIGEGLVCSNPHHGDLYSIRSLDLDQCGAMQASAVTVNSSGNVNTVMVIISVSTVLIIASIAIVVFHYRAVRRGVEINVETRSPPVVHHPSRISIDVDWFTVAMGEDRRGKDVPVTEL